jgi:hypothetical protein
MAVELWDSMGEGLEARNQGHKRSFQREGHIYFYNKKEGLYACHYGSQGSVVAEKFKPHEDHTAGMQGGAAPQASGVQGGEKCVGATTKACGVSVRSAVKEGCISVGQLIQTVSSEEHSQGTAHCPCGNR